MPGRDSKRKIPLARRAGKQSRPHRDADHSAKPKNVLTAARRRISKKNHLPAPPPPEPARAKNSPPASALPSPDEPTELTREAQAEPGFPIVGIGMSAGGLEALGQFLQHVPDQSGMAFVVVQHLDPNHRGMLVELLQRHTTVPVRQAEDGLRVEPDHVYVIPPSKDLSLLGGKLHLFPQAPSGLHLPVDFFFRSLAEDQQERGVGVILSGMGSDGTLGLRAMKEKAGACFVQALSSAKFDGMPRSAIDAGLADVIAPVEQLPGRICAYLAHAPHMKRPLRQLEDKALNDLKKVYVLLRSHTGNDFSLYKKSTLYRRIERRMGLHQIDNIDQYLRLLRENRQEIELLFKELLIGVTTFFRDPQVWNLLQQSALPALLATSASGGLLRAWVPGCSTGEEAYSLAMAFKEALEPFKSVRNIALQIFATDLDRDAIDKARRGLYPENIAADLSPERLRRFFVYEEHGYRVAKEIREMVVFAPQNLIMDPPFTKLDVICCRNLLIYFSGELQKRLIPLFHFSLNPGGLLLLGSAETVGAFTGLFAPLDGKARLYRRLEQPLQGVPVEFPSLATSDLQVLEDPPVVPPRSGSVNLQGFADRLIVQRFAPLGVLCDEKGDILYVSRRAGKYLEPAVGKATLNIFAMARDGLRYELTRLFTRALRQDGLLTVKEVKVGTNGGTQHVQLSVQRLTDPKELKGTVMVILADVEPLSNAATRSSRREAPRVAELKQELMRAREEAQTTREEMQTSQEELKSTNEELQSTNEELQSTNEELTTSKEEMQSLNEELQTVNHELLSKVDELSRANNDMKNLMNSTEIATLFLDGQLRVRRFTTPTAKIIKLIPGDIGRAISDIASDLENVDLAEEAREVLHVLTFKERQVATRDGRWFSIRIMPYRTVENVIDGVVITLTDASSTKALELALRERASELKQMAEALPDLVWYSRADGGGEYFSSQWLDYTGVPATEHLGFGWLERVHGEDRDRLREGWRNAVKAGTRFDAEFRLRNASGEYRWFKARAVPIRDSNGRILRWYCANTDVNDLKSAGQAEQTLTDGG